MRAPRPAVIDFETESIQSRPSYPPVPVGVSIKWPGKKPRYHAWGHRAGGNNATMKGTKAELKAAIHHPEGCLFQNAKFDLDVAETHFGIAPPVWHQVQDTLFLLFLKDPDAGTLELKPAAERILGWLPEERDEVKDWLLAHQPVPGVKISDSRKSEHYYMNYLAYAPGDIVGRYANGDTARCDALFRPLWTGIVERGMGAAYDRERRLAPLMLAAERRGLRVDVPALERDVASYEVVLASIDAYLRRRLKVGESINLDSDKEMLPILLSGGWVDEAKLLQTPKSGKGGNPIRYSTSKGSLEGAMADRALSGTFRYRAQLKTCLQTYMRSWLAMARGSGGFIYGSWNQTRNAEGSGVKGTRTGRMSVTWFMNMPKEFAPIFAHERKGLPRCPVTVDAVVDGRRVKGDALPPLPLCRGYVLPYNKGDVIIDRDYCFSPDTELLTRDGFIRFDALPKKVQAAQWKEGRITYAAPLSRQVLNYRGPLIHIVGERSADLMVTPDHRCLIDKYGREEFVRAADYPVGKNRRQIHAGVLSGNRSPSRELLALIAAIQADATVRPKSTGGVVWKLKKPRKVERLRGLLEALKIEFFHNNDNDDGFHWFRVKERNLPAELHEYLDLKPKTFKRTLIDLEEGARLEFLRELRLWDGTHQNGNRWSYFNTHRANVELVQEMAVQTGLRSNLKIGETRNGKGFYAVSMRYNLATLTNTFTKVEVPYEGKVYCVTMPHGTVIVRRNGKVCVTGQCQQEPHILAHFENAELMRQYQADPWLDVHDQAKAYIQQVYGLDLPRKNVKIINLGIIYGKGVGLMAKEMDETVERTKQVRDLILGLYPGLEGMNTDMKALSAAGEPLVTWGGREYFCEPPLLFEGRVIKFEYKMVNRLVQGSAADCTKEAIIRYHEMAGLDDVFMLQVHDQMAASAPRKRAREAMDLMRRAMETIKFDVAMVTEGDVGENWGALKPYDVGPTKWRELEKKGATKGVVLRTERNMSECLPGY